MMDHQDEPPATAVREQGRGRHAERPMDIPAKGWRDILWRTAEEVAEDRVTLIAAGVTYYLLLASFPALAALVAIYGLFSDPSDIGEQIRVLSAVLPPGALDLVLGQLSALTSQKTSTLSLAFFVGLAVALWSANRGMKALFDAMNVAYGEHEKRGVVALNLRSLAFTAGALIVAVCLVFAVGVVPAILAFVHLDTWAEIIASLSRWPIVLVIVWVAAMVIYRFGPSRENAKFRWISWGAAVSAVAWMVMSIVFSYYLQHFAHYNATYGALGALIGFMVWTWLSVSILIVGAELDAEIEHQTAIDTTTGAPRPLGLRGAVMADTVGRAVD